MMEMLSRANQGLHSTAITVEQLWDRHSMNWIEVRRLEMELGAGGDRDCPYSSNVPTTNLPLLAWMKLRALRARGELVPWTAPDLHLLLLQDENVYAKTMSASV